MHLGLNGLIIFSHWHVGVLPFHSIFEAITWVPYRQLWVDILYLLNEHIPFGSSLKCQSIKNPTRWAATVVNRYIPSNYPLAALTRAPIWLKTLPVQQRYLLTCSYNIALLYSPGCIHILFTYQTLITLVTLITVAFMVWTDDVNGPLAAFNWYLPLQVSDGYFY